MPIIRTPFLTVMLLNLVGLLLPAVLHLKGGIGSTLWSVATMLPIIFLTDRLTNRQIVALMTLNGGALVLYAVAVTNGFYHP